MSGEVPASDAAKILMSMTCPGCGGQVECEEGEDLVLCKYCGTMCSLENDAGSSRLMYKLKVTKEQVLKEVQSWMGSGPKAKDLRTASTITETYPIYLPFWRMTARGNACVCGVEIKHTKHGEVKKPHESLVNREYVCNFLACDPGDLGIVGLNVAAGAEAIPYDDQDIALFQASGSRTDAFKIAGELIKEQALKDAKRSITNINFSMAVYFPKSFNLLYYPFWIVRYKYQERDYFVTVDGVSGRTVSGRAPGSAGAQSTAAGAGGTISGALAGAAASGAFVYFTTTGSSDGYQGVIFVCLLILSAALFVFRKCWMRFRYGDEVLSGEVKGKGLNMRNTVTLVQNTGAPKYDYFN